MDHSGGVSLHLIVLVFWKRPSCFVDTFKKKSFTKQFDSQYFSTSTFMKMARILNLCTSVSYFVLFVVVVVVVVVVTRLFTEHFSLTSNITVLK